MRIGDLRDAVAMALEGAALLEEAEAAARRLCGAVDELVRAPSHRLLARDVARLLLGVERVLRTQRFASAHVEASLRFVHEVLGAPGGGRLTVSETDTLFALSLRSLATQRRTSDLMEAVVHVLRASLASGVDVASTSPETTQ